MAMGPFIGAAGAEVAKSLSGGRRRKDERLAAASQAATAYQSSRHALIGAMARSGITRDEFDLLADRLDVLDAGETQRVKIARNGMVLKRGIAAAALASVVGGGLLALHEVKGLFHIPVSVTTTQHYDAALLRVQKLADQRLVRGTGVGGADMSLQLKVGPLTMPSGLVGEHAQVQLPRGEEISLRQGGVRVERADIGGKPRVLLMVDPRKVQAEITGDQAPLPGSGASVGALNSIGQVVGLGRDEQAKAYQDVTSMAARSFEAMAASRLTAPKVLAALAVDDVRKEMRAVAGGVAGEAQGRLLQAAAGTMFVEFAKLGGGAHDGNSTFVPPGREQSLISLPMAPQASAATFGNVVLHAAPETSQLQSVSAGNSLAAIANEPGFVLLGDPVDL